MLTKNQISLADLIRYNINCYSVVSYFFVVTL